MEGSTRFLDERLSLEESIPDTREINIQQDLSSLSHAAAFYMKNGFIVTYNSAIEWKTLQYCDWHRIFSHQTFIDQEKEVK